MTPDLVAWLRQQLDHDEQVARAAMAGEGDDGVWTTESAWPDEGGRRVEGAGITIYDEGGHDEHQAAHIALHDPARVLRQVATHRAILGRHQPLDVVADPGGYRPFPVECAWCTEGYDPDHDAVVRRAWPCPDVRDLLSVYEDRPGYDPAWKVEGAEGCG